jgi:hypothetical protein
MEVTASQRNDLAIGRVVAGLGADLPSPLRGMTPLLEIFQQQRPLVPGAHDQDEFAALQRLPDPRKKGGIVKGLAGADRIGLVMQMPGCQISVNCVRSSTASNPR